MDTTARFRAAVEGRELEAFEDLFADDVRMCSPVKFTPFEGKPMVLGVLVRTFGEFRYVGEFDGTAEPAAGGKEIQGMDLLRFGEDGRIAELTVMARPASAVQALGEAVLAGLVEDGLASAPK